MDRDLQLAALLLVGGLIVYQCFTKNINRSRKEWRFHVQEGLPEDQPWTVLTQGPGKGLNDAFLLNPH